MRNNKVKEDERNLRKREGKDSRIPPSNLLSKLSKGVRVIYINHGI